MPTTPRTLHGATFNVERGRTGKQLTEFLGFLEKYLVSNGLHFILLQEVNGMLPALRGIPGYDLIVFPESLDKGDNAILVRRDVDHGPGRSYKVGWFWFTARGNKFWSRSVVTVGLDGWLRVFNVHMPVQVLNHSTRFAGPARRIAAYRGTAALLVRLIGRNTLKASIAGGDWNATTSSTGYGTPSWIASKAGMLKQPGGRIDWVMSKKCAVTNVHVDATDGGSDHKPVRFTVTEILKPSTSTGSGTGGVHSPPSVPVIPARWHGGPQTPKTIVIHGTVSPCVRGGARSVAKFFAQRPETSKTSAHYTVDPGEVIQSVGDHTVAYHCGYNQDSIGIELCDPQAGPGSRWANTNHEAMLSRAAKLVAQLCLAYKIPATRVTPAALAAGKHGICGHVDMSRAFHKSTHVDPGPDFPWTEFMHQVNTQIDRLTA